METITTHLPLDTFFVEKDWPVIPDNLCQELIEYSKTASNVWEGFKNQYTTFAQYSAPDNLKKWVQDNMPWIPNDYEIRLQGIINGEDLAPHKDAMRGTSFNFVISDDDSTTHWFDDDGNKIRSFKYKPKVWYQHQSQVTHSVDNGKAGRLAVTIFKFELQSWFKR